jgi:nucleoside-diphosphate-sugar epimerase
MFQKSVESKPQDIVCQPEKVLVIGGAGYIGSTLVRQLLQARYRVRVLDCLLFGDKPIQDLYRHPASQFLHGDFRNAELLIHAISGTDAVIHLGAIVGDAACDIDPDLTLSINTRALPMICDLCQTFAVRRYLFASSCSVYGTREDLIDEHCPLAPLSLYARTKIEAERVLLEKRSALFQPTVLRLASAFGLSYRMRFDLVVNWLTAQAVVQSKITIINGQQWRPFLHVTDIARAFLAVLEAPVDLVGGEVFNVGDNDANMRLRDLGEQIVRLVPGTTIHDQLSQWDMRSYLVDFSKITRRLGFRCGTTVHMGILQMIDVLGRNRFLGYEDLNHHNAQHLRSCGQLLLRKNDA